LLVRLIWALNRLLSETLQATLPCMVEKSRVRFGREPVAQLRPFIMTASAT
jgi:hypothetical protein